MFVFLFLSFYVIGPRSGDKQKKKKVMWNCPFYMGVSNHTSCSPTDYSDLQWGDLESLSFYLWNQQSSRASPSRKDNTTSGLIM